METRSSQGEATQDDIFKVSVPGKREEDYEGAGVPISVFEDLKFQPEGVQRQEILDFGDEGFLLNNLLTPEECSHIINEGETIGFKPIDHGQLDYRSSERILLRCPALSELLFSRVRPYLSDVLISGDPAKQHIQGIELTLKGAWAPKGLNEIWRLCRYYPGGHFGPHYDGHFVRSLGERSLKTFMIYLNANFTEGTTNFIKEGQKLFKDETGKFCAEDKNILCRLQPLEGQAIIFNHHRLHEGGKLKDGVKYILRTDLMYERTDGQTFSESEEKAILLLQEAERFEEQKRGTESAECYRRAFKLWSALADSFNS